MTQQFIYTATADTIPETMSTVAGQILDLHQQYKIDVIIEGEDHTNFFHKIAQASVNEIILPSLKNKIYTVERSTSDITERAGYYRLLQHISQNYRCASAYQWVEFYEQQYPRSDHYGDFLMGQAASYNATIKTIDCNRSMRRRDDEYYWQINDKEISPQALALLQSSAYFQDIRTRYPLVLNPFMGEANSAEGMTYRDTVIAADTAVLVNETNAPIITTNGRSHIADIAYPERPTMAQMLVQNGLNIVTISLIHSSDEEKYDAAYRTMQQGCDKNGLIADIRINMPHLALYHCGFNQLKEILQTSPPTYVI